MLGLNRKIASLILVAGSVTTRELGDKQVTNQKLADASLDFAKTNAAFASAVLDTQRRVASIGIGAGAQAVAGASFDASALLAGVPVSTALPVYSAATRQWSNLGAATYAPTGTDAGNKVMLRAPGTQGPDATDTLKDAAGREIFGRLINAGGPTGTWTVTFYVSIAGVETATIVVATNAYLTYRQWVPGSSPLLEDTGRAVVTSPGAVDVSESNNATQLASELGVVLGGTGAATLPFGKTFRQKWLDHLAGVVSERHTSDQVDASSAAIAAIPGAAPNATADGLFEQLQINLTTASAGAATMLRTYFKELRSPGVLGTAAVLSSSASNTVTVAAVTAYVAGKRFDVPGATYPTVNGSTAVYWVDSTGAVVSGASYPAIGDFAELGTAFTDGTGVVALVDDHRALVHLDQKVIDVENALAMHIALVTAHPAANITVIATALTDAFAAPMTNPDTSAIGNVQQALNALAARMNAARKHFKIVKVTNSGNPASATEGDLAAAVADPAVAPTAKYLILSLPAGAKYKTGTDTMECIIDSNDQDKLDVSDPLDPKGVFYEQDDTHVRIYFDSAQDPLQVGMSVKLRWQSL